MKAGKGGGFREGAGWERRGPDQRGIPQDSSHSSPGTARGGITRTRPEDPRAHAPPAAQAASLPGCTHTVHMHTPGLPGTPDLQGRARQATGPRGPHTCTDSRPHTQISGATRAAPAAQTLRHSPTASPRLHADASERDWRRAGPRSCRGLPEVGPLPAGLPLRAPARGPACGPPSRTPAPCPRAPAARPHSLSAPMRLRLRLWPRLVRGLAGAGGAAEVTAGAERAGAGAGTPLLPPEAPLLPCLTPAAPRLPRGPSPSPPARLSAAPYLSCRPPNPARQGGDGRGPRRGRRWVRPGISDWGPGTALWASQYGQRHGPTWTSRLTSRGRLPR